MKRYEFTIWTENKGGGRMNHDRANVVDYEFKEHGLRLEYLTEGTEYFPYAGITNIQYWEAHDV